MFFIPRSDSPPCHPERSGTPGVGANATTEQRRAVEPRPPGGAPAGGISVAERHHLTHRTARSSLPPGGEGVAPATDEGETGERDHAGRPCLRPLPPEKRNRRRAEFVKKSRTPPGGGVGGGNDKNSDSIRVTAVRYRTGILICSFGMAKRAVIPAYKAQ